MFDINSFFERLKSGDVDDIFVYIYSYFVVGYIILFTVYEQNFTNLELFTQVVLSIGISFPITTSSIILLNPSKTSDDKKGFFHPSMGEMFFTSFSYSTFFSLFYIAKPLINFYGPFSALIIIAFNFVFFRLLRNK